MRLQVVKDIAVTQEQNEQKEVIDLERRERAQIAAHNPAERPQNGVDGAHLLGRVEHDRLCEGPVAGRIPRGEAHPLLARGIEREAEPVTAEGPEIGGRNDLAAGLLAIAPH